MPNHTASVYITAMIISKRMVNITLSEMPNTLHNAADNKGVARENVVAIPASIARMAVISMSLPHFPSTLSLSNGRHASEKR